MLIDQEYLFEYLLSKQCIGPYSKSNPLDVFKSMIVIHASRKRTPYYSLNARIKNFSYESFETLIYDNDIYFVRAMRNTLHLVHCSDRCLISIPTIRARNKIIEYRLNRMGSDFVSLKKIEKNIISDLEYSKPLDPKIVKNMSYIQKTAVRHMFENNILRRNFFDDSYNRYSYIEEAVDEFLALSKLVSRYITSFGPVTIDDITWWIGASKRSVKRCLEKLTTDGIVSNVELSQDKNSYFMTKSDLKKYEAFTPLEWNEVVLLPPEDPLLKSYGMESRRRLLAKFDISIDHVMFKNGESKEICINKGIIDRNIFS